MSHCAALTLSVRYRTQIDPVADAAFLPTSGVASRAVATSSGPVHTSTRTQQSAGEVIDDRVLTSKVKVALIDDPVT